MCLELLVLDQLQPVSEQLQELQAGLSIEDVEVWNADIEEKEREKNLKIQQNCQQRVVSP